MRQKCNQVFIQKSHAFIDFFFTVSPERLLKYRILVKENLRTDKTKESVNCSNCVIASLHIASSLVRDLKKTFEIN